MGKKPKKQPNGRPSERFRQSLAEIRAARQLSIPDMARNLDCNVHTYRKYEYGQRVPHVDDMANLAAKLGKTLGEMIR